MSLSISRTTVLPVLAVLLISAIGTTLLLESHAAPAPSANGYYKTITGGISTLKSGTTCAAEVKARNNSWDPRYKSNNTANHTVYSATSPTMSTYKAHWAGDPYFSRVDGNFAGTTDQVLQWASCKWGFEDNLFRADGIQETGWDQTAAGDLNNGACPPTEAVFKNGVCAASYGFIQDKYEFHKEAWPMFKLSTAFELDYALAQDRKCFDSHGGTATNNVIWACFGEWFSGGYGENDYSNRVKGFYNAKPWLTWQDEAPGTGTQDTQAPTIKLPPASTAPVSGIVTITPTANDNVGVTKIEVLVDGQVAGTGTTNPYTFNWNTKTYKNANHTVQAKAYDAAGHVGSSPINTYTVENTDIIAPSAPVGLTATATGPQSANIVWKASTDTSGIAGYYLFRKGGSNGTTPTQIGLIGATTYSDTRLSPSTTYEYQVQAVDTAANASVKSTAVLVTTPPISTDTVLPVVKITAPTDGQIITSTSVSIGATATDNVAVTRITAFIDGVPLANPLVPASSPTTYATTWNTTGTPNGSHIIRVVAYDAAGNPGETKITVTINRTVNLSPPSSVKADLGPAGSAGGIIVTWNESTVSGTGYYIQRLTKGDGPTTVGQVATGTRIFTDKTAPANGTTYWYQVVAFDAAGNVSSPSPLSNGVTLQPPTSKPSIRRINTGGGSYAAAGSAAAQIWITDQYSSGGKTDNQGVGHDIAGTSLDPLYQDERYGPMTYNIPVTNGKYTVKLHFAEIYSGCQKAGCRVFNVSVNGKLFLDSFDIFAKVGGYTADVEQTTTAINGGMLSINFTSVRDNPQIAAIEILPADTSVPTTPLNAVAKTVSNSQINVLWNQSTDDVGVTSYQIFRNNSLTPVATVSGQATNTGALSWGDTGLTPGTTYTYTVKAVDGAGNVSLPSNTASATTLTQPTATGGLKGVITVSNPTNPYKCPSDPQLVKQASVPAKGSTTYICTQKVQWFLNHYQNAGLVVDGWQGANTCAAINRFKVKFSLAADCVFGTSAWSHLESLGGATAIGSGAHISYETTGGARHIASADNKGNYSFTAVPSGNHYFTYSLANYASQSPSISIPSNQTVTKNVTLKHL